MIKILFICHGNICRSPMAEFIMKDLVEKAGLSQEIFVSSAAMTSEEIGNDMYPPAKRMLTAMGVPFEKRKARRMTKADYEENDIIIGMDEENWRHLLLLTGGRKEKLHLLMDYTDRPGEVADPCYTGDFKETYRDILDGCRGLLAAIRKDERI